MDNFKRVRQAMLMLVALGFCIPTVSCVEKRTRSLTLEGPESVYELELETVDKDPDE